MSEKTRNDLHKLSGDGTKKSPYIITNVHELQLINNGLSYSYKLANDIDASETKTWNNGKGFEPLGTSKHQNGNPFTGYLNGNGYTISNLYINRPNRHNTGLFGVIDESAIVTNAKLKNAIVNGNFAVGSVVGHNSNGNVIDFELHNVSVSGKKVVGGIVGWNENPSGLLRVKSIETYVKGIKDVGGIVGDNSGYVMSINLGENICCISKGNIGDYCATNNGYCEPNNV